MKLDFKLPAMPIAMAVAMPFGMAINAQSSCYGVEKHDGVVCMTQHQNNTKPSCSTSATANDATSGCSPSSCHIANVAEQENKRSRTLRFFNTFTKTECLTSTSFGLPVRNGIKQYSTI